MLEISPDEDDFAAVEVKNGSTNCRQYLGQIAQINSEKTCSPYLGRYKLPEDELRSSLIKCCECDDRVFAQVSSEEICTHPYPYERKSRL